MELIKRAGAPAPGETIDSIEKLFEAFKALGERQREKLFNCIDAFESP